MADGVELLEVTTIGERLAVPDTGSRDASDDEAPRSGRQTPNSSGASPRASPRPSPRASPRASPRESPSASPSGSSGDIAGGNDRGAYQRKITPASGSEVARYKPRGSPSPARKMSKMELEALRDRKRMGHMKEMERLLTEALPGGGHVFTQDSFVAAITSPDAIANFFGLFDWDGAGYLDQTEWVEFLKGRQKTNQQRELVEVIETAAYLICGYHDVTYERFASILQARGVAPKFYRILQEKTNNHVTVKGAMDFIANLSNARPRTGFTKENLEWLEQLFRGQLKNSQELHLDDFTKIVHSKNPFFAERVFQIFDRDNSGTVSLQEFLDSMHQFAGQSHDDKIRFLFKVYDLDGDGLIQHNELEHVIHACMEENGMRFSDDQIEDLTSALFEDADVEDTGAITYEALKAQLEKHEGLLENLSISIDRWLVPPQPKKQTSPLKKLSGMIPYQFSMPYIRNNYVYLTFLFLFLAVNIGMFVARIVQFLGFPVAYIMARACGYVLNFCCAFIVAVMLRNLITLARTNGLASILPLDEHIYIHKMTGWFIFVYSVVHTIAHFINFAVNVVNPEGALAELNTLNLTYAEWLLTTKPQQFGLVKGFANPSGIALMVILAVIVICSQPFVRKTGNFEVFYWTHLLYVPFYILLILHAPNFWHWFIVPGLLYLLERVVRLVRTKTGHGRTYISSGILLPSKVTHLVIKRPASMDYHPGDYLFVNIPAIAKSEWHPFTISSAPEQDETLWLHIRALGGWTHRLYDYFEEEQLKIRCLEEGKDPDEVLRQDRSSIQKMKKSIKRLAPSTDKSRRISFNTKPPEVRTEGVVNEGCDEEAAMQSIEEEKEVAPAVDGTHLAPPGVRFNNKKQPLMKARSLPDMDHRMKKRQKLLLLRGEMRSNSETKFDEVALAKARNQLHNSPYLNPQNKSVAKSFRYMRRKPTIIAFKTPSSDNLAADEEERTPKNESREAKMEEGRFEAVAMTEGDAVKYPVGKPLEIYIDGPYGTPSSHIFRAQHAVLIGTGIGVTPFASILQSIMYRYWKNRHKCPRCEHEFTSELPEGIMKLKKVDFFWINRDQRSFEWFVNLLSQLEIEQAEQGGVMDRFLDMHMYITSALQKTDMKAVGLQLALDLLHEKEKRDMITGLKTRTIAGRPNWNKVFRQIQEQKKGKVTVFFCGPPQLSRTLRYKCDEFGFKFRKENF